MLIIAIQSYAAPGAVSIRRFFYAAGLFAACPAGASPFPPRFAPCISLDGGNARFLPRIADRCALSFPRFFFPRLRGSILSSADFPHSDCRLHAGHGRRQFCQQKTCRPRHQPFGIRRIHSASSCPCARRADLPARTAFSLFAAQTARRTEKRLACDDRLCPLSPRRRADHLRKPCPQQPSSSEHPTHQHAR